MIGTFGYVAIEGWSVFDAFYMTAISITTVGFGETKPLSPEGKIFTILIIFVGLGAAAVFASHLAKAFLESHFKNFFGASKMLKKINRLKDHYIICGYGGVGSAICGTLSNSGIKFVVVEQDDEVAKWAEKRNFMTVIGKATYDATLIQAGIKHAKGIVVSMGDDSLNMYVSLAARELNKDIFIIARGYKADIESRLVRAGANTVVYPIKMGGEQIAQLIKRQLHSSQNDNTREESSSVMGYTLRQYKHSGEVSISIGDLSKNLNAMSVVTLKKKGTDNEIQSPESNILISDGDSLLLVVSNMKKDGQKVKPDSAFYWSEKFELGHDILDEEHRELFHTCYDFVETVKSNADKEIIIQAYNQVVDSTLDHFESEERLFNQYNYPIKKDHMKIHKKLLTNIRNLNKRRDYNFNDDLEEDLFLSLTDHILEHDKLFVDYIKETFRG